MVYTRGVAHHTGDMWTALGDIVPNLKAVGILVVSIYNDQGETRRRWAALKRVLNKAPVAGKRMMRRNSSRLIAQTSRASCASRKLATSEPVAQQYATCE